MRTIRKLSRDQQLAGLAAILLFFTLFLPWYRTSPVINGRVIGNNLSAFEVFSFVEAAVLVVSAAVLYLLLARARERAFHLPGGDGWAVTIAGGWAVFLIIWRFFDKPDVNPGPVGIQWGAFVALVAAGLLAAAGQRLRVGRTPEPPNPAEDPTWETPRRTRRRDDADRRPVDTAKLRRTLREERPAWEGEPPAVPGATPEPPPPPPPPPPPTRALPDEDRPTRRLGADDDAEAARERAERRRAREAARSTRRLPPDDAGETRRLPPEDPPPTRRLPPDEPPPTRRLPPEEPPPTRRLPDDDDDALF